MHPFFATSSKAIKYHALLINPAGLCLLYVCTPPANKLMDYLAVQGEKSYKNEYLKSRLKLWLHYRKNYLQRHIEILVSSFPFMCKKVVVKCWASLFKDNNFVFELLPAHFYRSSALCLSYDIIW